MLQGQPNAMHHEPGGFLGDAKTTSDLIGRNAILGIGQHPERKEPIIQLNRTILEDGPYLGAVLLPAQFALIDRPRLHIAVFMGSAAWTSRTLRPTQGTQQILAPLLIREVLNGFLKRWLARSDSWATSVFVSGA